MKLLKKFVPCGEWMPDQAEYSNEGAPAASNILWRDGHYVPALAFNSLGQALPARCQGACAITDLLENIHIYAGTGTQLLEYIASSFSNVSKGGGSPYTTQDAQFWKFAQFSTSGYGNLLFATNLNDQPQQIQPGVTGAFVDVPASTGTVPKASAIGVIGQFVVLGNTEDPVNSFVPYRVQWCGINNPTYWGYTSLADQQAQAGQQFMNANYGPVTHISNGGTFGLIFQERAITRMYYVGGDAIFDFTGTVDLQRGCLFPNSPVQIGSQVYFIAHDGFFMTDGMSVTPIGHGKVDSTFLNDVNPEFPERVRGSYDPVQKLIFWSYCSNANSTGIPDKVVTYNYAENRFTPVTQSLSMLFTSRSFGYTMDTLDNVSTNLDSIFPSLDSPFWEGGNTQIGAFDGNNNYGSLNGAALTASIDTTEFDPNPGALSDFQGIRPIFSDSVGNGVATVTPSTRMTENTAYTIGAAAAVNPRTGMCDFFATGRYIRGTISIAGGFDKLTGMDVYAQPAGEA